MPMSGNLRKTLISGLTAGIAAGLAYGLLLGERGHLPLLSGLLGSTDPWILQIDGLLLGGAIGVVFGMFMGGSVATAGSGLMWGVTHGLVWWILGPITFFPLFLGGPDWSINAARLAFPLLLGYLVCYGAGLGLAYRVLFAALTGIWRRPALGLILEYCCSILIGGMAGLVGGLAFGAWMERVGFFPLVAGLVRSSSPDVGRMLHFIISVIIGTSYGLLFRRDIQGTGSSIAWGVAYGMIWWILGALTIMPWWLGHSVQWSLAAAQGAFPSLIGHLIYGILLGLVYSVVDRLWRLLFVESDPLKREPEGPGTRSLRALGLGILASLAGGLAFTVVMLETGALPDVASLIGRSSPMAGFVVHMVISAIIGATYGLLFRREAYTYGAGLVWGLVYGVIWWLLGPLTLMPILLGAEVQWSLNAALAAYPSLIGHLAYGSSTALVYHLLVLRYDPGMRSSVRALRTRRQRVPGTPAPALWVLVLVLGITLPLLFS